ncbi:hypothetical protein D3C73_782030 [compost metagenome]
MVGNVHDSKNCAFAGVTNIATLHMVLIPVQKEPSTTFYRVYYSTRRKLGWMQILANRQLGLLHIDYFQRYMVPKYKVIFHNHSMMSTPRRVCR